LCRYNEANAVEAGEMEEALSRVERDNLARMAALYQRHMHETEEVSKRAAERDRVLLQSHLATAHRLLSSGVKLRNVEAAREEMAKHLKEAERGVAKDAKKIGKQSDEAFASVAVGVESHLKKVARKGPLQLPRDEHGDVDWMHMPEPPKSVLEANGIDRVKRASDLLARAMAKRERAMTSLTKKGTKVKGLKLGGMGGLATLFTDVILQSKHGSIDDSQYGPCNQSSDTLFTQFILQ
jgi:hypothetical protein